MFVRPTPGFQVFDPVQRDFLPDAGREVPNIAYWQRMLAERAVYEGATPPPPPPTNVVVPTEINAIVRQVMRQALIQAGAVTLPFNAETGEITISVPILPALRASTIHPVSPIDPAGPGSNT